MCVFRYYSAAIIGLLFLNSRPCFLLKFPKFNQQSSPIHHKLQQTILLQLKLSQEHQGWAFEKDPEAAATLLQHHSGGKCSKALRMATTVGSLL